MINWISANLETILICLVLLAVVSGIVWSMLQKKKQGKSSCGCGCAGCAMQGACHSQK